MEEVHDKAKFPIVLCDAAKQNLNTWVECMWTSGGNLNVGKCFCYSFEPKLNHKTQRLQYKKTSLSQQTNII